MKFVTCLILFWCQFSFAIDASFPQLQDYRVLVIADKKSEGLEPWEKRASFTDEENKALKGAAVEVLSDLVGGMLEVITGNPDMDVSEASLLASFILKSALKNYSKIKFDVGLDISVYMIPWSENVFGGNRNFVSQIAHERQIPVNFDVVGQSLYSRLEAENVVFIPTSEFDDEYHFLSELTTFVPGAIYNSALVHPPLMRGPFNFAGMAFQVYMQPDQIHAQTQALISLDQFEQEVNKDQGIAKIEKFIIPTREKRSTLLQNEQGIIEPYMLVQIEGRAYGDNQSDVSDVYLSFGSFDGLTNANSFDAYGVQFLAPLSVSERLGCAASKFKGSQLPYLSGKAKAGKASGVLDALGLSELKVKIQNMILEVKPAINDSSSEQINVKMVDAVIDVAGINMCLQMDSVNVQLQSEFESKIDEAVAAKKQELEDAVGDVLGFEINPNMVLNLIKSAEGAK